MIRLYDLTLSGHCHKARLFLSILDLPHETVPVDFAAGQHKSPAFLAVNPLGQVLEDDGVVIRDSNAILVYLAEKYDDGTWLPRDPLGRARVQEWLSVSGKEIALGPATARVSQVFGGKPDPRAIERSHLLLPMFEAHLAGRDWLATDRPTIADLACYTYIAHAPEGGVSLDPYPQLRGWLARIEALPGFAAMPRSAIPALA